MDNIVDSKWVFDLKKDELGYIVKFKARLVALGFKQREGIDFSEIFPPTVFRACVRLLTAIACILDSDLDAFNVGKKGTVFKFYFARLAYLGQLCLYT